MKVSILVSMYNKSFSVINIIDKMLIPSLIRNASKDKELIILDDFSPLKEETEKMISKNMPVLKKVFGKVIFSRNIENLGFAGSYNRAISMSRGRYLIITNDDIYFPKNSINYLLECLKDKKVGLVGPITGWKAGTYQYCKQAPKLEEYSWKSYKRIEDFAKKVKFLMANEPVKKTLFITGFCFATRKDVLNEVGGFDGRFKYGHIEDTDLVRRISLKYSTIIAPSVYVHHGGIEGASVSIVQNPFKLKKYRIINSYKYIKKWHDFWGFIKLIANSIGTYLGYNTVSDLMEEKLKSSKLYKP